MLAGDNNVAGDSLAAISCQHPHCWLHSGRGGGDNYNNNNNISYSYILNIIDSFSDITIQKSVKDKMFKKRKRKMQTNAVWSVGDRQLMHAKFIINCA